MAEEEEKPKEKRFTKEFVEKWSKTTEEESSPEEAILEKQRKLLEKDPKNEKVWYARGLLLMDMGRNAEAIESLDKVVSINPDFPGVWNARAEVLRRLDRPDEASESLRKALEHVGPQLDAKFREKMKKPESFDEILRETVEKPSKEEEELPFEGEISDVLEELETLGDAGEHPPEMSPEEKEYHSKMNAWEAQGFNVQPLRDILANEPYKARTVFFQFEQNVSKVAILRETLDGIKVKGFEEEIERLREAMKSPMNIWRVEAEMGKLLPRVEKSVADSSIEPPSIKAAREAVEAALLPKPSPARPVGPLVSKPPGLRAAEGKVNGISAGGRVNGLAAGGRVNGLVAGGHVNGLAAGGRVNGLVNGLRSSKTGLTNGLTNGNGFTNGLGSNRFRRETMYRRWKLGLVPAVAAILIAVALFNAPTTTVTGPSGGITIDGNAGDWSGVPGFTQTQDVPQDNVNVTGYRLLYKDGVLSILIEVKGLILGDTANLDSFYAFIDSDGSMSTGYRLRDLGADFMIEVTGGQGKVNISALSMFIDSNPGGNDNWTAWAGMGGVKSAASGSTLELQVETERLSSTRSKFDENAFEATIVSDDNQGVGSTTVAKLGSSFGALLARQEGGPTIVNAGASETMLTVTLQAIGSTVHVSQIQFTKSPKVVIASSPTDFDVVPGSPETRDIKIDTTGTTTGDFLALEISAVEADKPVSIFGDPGRAYVGSIPVITGRRIDGIFQDWPTNEFKNDTYAVTPRNLDIIHYATNRTISDAYFYIDVRGSMMAGTPVAQLRMHSVPFQGSPSPPQAPMPKRGEDIMRIYLDSDSQDGEGLPVLGLPGADYMIEVKGMNGKIASRKLFMWSNGGWISQAATPSAEIDSRRMEAGLGLASVTVNAMQVAFESSSWQSVADTTQASSVRSRTRGDVETVYEALYSVALPNEISPGRVISFETGGSSLDWTLPSEISHLDAGSSRTIAELSATKLVSDGTRAAYPDAYAPIGIDVEYMIDDASLKEQFVIESPMEALRSADSGAIRFQFGMTVGDNLTVYVDGTGPQEEVVTTRSISFLRDNNEAFSIPPAIAWDSAGLIVQLPYTWHKAGPSLSLDVPVSYLKQSSYPVIIDPWINYTLTNYGGPMAGTNEQMGNRSVAVSDFNNDGYADVLVGGPFNNKNGSNAGAAYIFNGPLTSQKTQPDVNFNGTSGCRKGIAVTAGKLNNDQFWDAVITQYLCTNTYTFIYHGRGSWPLWVPSANVSIKALGLPTTARFGESVAAGNVDGAFYDDLIIGAPGKTNVAVNDGAAYVFLSPFASIVSSANFTLFPQTNSSGFFGNSIAVGLVDSDTRSDIVIGEPTFNSDQGRASLFKGSNLTSGFYKLPSASVVGGSSGERFGWSVAVGKLNSDAYEDLAVGAPYYGSSGNRDGRVYLFLATSSGLSSGQSPSAQVTSQSSGERFGMAVHIGPILGPNQYNLAVGAPLAAAGGSLRGSVYVFDQPLTSSTPTKTQSGDNTNENMGYGLAGGKFANDDFYRLAIGAPRYPVGTATSAGRVVVLYYIPEFGDVAVLLPAVILVVFMLGRRRRKTDGV